MIYVRAECPSGAKEARRRGLPVECVLAANRGAWLVIPYDPGFRQIIRNWFLEHHDLRHRGKNGVPEIFEITVEMGPTYEGWEDA